LFLSHAGTTASKFLACAPDDAVVELLGRGPPGLRRSGWVAPDAGW
jgi:hypothetical protein